jgi:hypothetical protein
VTTILKRLLPAPAKRAIRRGLRLLREATVYLTRRTLEVLPPHRLANVGNLGVELYQKTEIEKRRRNARELGPVALVSQHGKRLERSVHQESPPWKDIDLSEPGIPGMITAEEARYYQYIGDFYSGVGEAIELGPWLGRSTFYIVQGLRANPRFAAHKLRVFDDFVWRPGWMDQYVPVEQRLPRHESFYPMFERYIGPIGDDIQVTRCRIAPYDGNEALPPFAWDGSRIEMLFIDCGRTIEANNAWYEKVRDSLIPNRSLIVLQDWGTHRETPVKHYNQMHLFTGMKSGELELVHELRDGALATFLYRGV